MNFTINRNILLSNLNNVGKALSSRIQMPGLTGILFGVSRDCIVLTASNSEIAIRSEIKEGFTVIGEGDFLLQGKYLIEIIRKMNSKDVDFMSFEETAIKILGGKSVFTLKCLPIAGFPRIDFRHSDVRFTIDALNLKQIIKKTVFAISGNESRVILTGVSVKTKNNKIEVTATDSYRLSRKEMEFDYSFPDIDIVIPGKSLEELNKIIGEDEKIVEIHCSSSKILFKTENIMFQSRLIDGVFPVIDSLIPKKHINSLTFRKEDLLSAIDRVSVFVTAETSNIVKLTIGSDGNVEFASMTSEFGDAKEDMEPIKKANNNALQIAFSSKYFIEAVKSFDTDEVTVNFSGEIKPFTVTSEKEPRLIQLILPVRI